MLHEFLLGLIKIHILFHASKGAVYGVALMDELRHHGYKIGPGTLYPILHALENEELLKSDRQNINGKVRRYYHITQKGIQSFSEARVKVKELINEIVEENYDK
jgi:PadR family transcriptional regulator PadR